MYRTISRDVKIAAIQLSERQLLPLDDILLCCGISRRTFYRIQKLWQTTGDVIDRPPITLSGRPRGLHRDDIHYLLQLVRQNPDYFLDELLNLLKTNRFISVHYTTIHDELQRAGVSHKRLQRIALERNEILRAGFISRMAQFSPEELGFIDEVSKDERTVGRRYGRSKRGTRARKSHPFVRGRRTSTVGVLSVDGFVAGTSVEGSLTKASFLQWMELVVVRRALILLTGFSANGQVSYPSVARIPALSASWYLTTLGSTTAESFSSSPIDSAFASSTCLRIRRTSTPSKRHSPRSSISFVAIKTTTVLQRETGFSTTCTRYSTS